MANVQKPAQHARVAQQLDASTLTVGVLREHFRLDCLTNTFPHVAQTEL